MAKTADAGWKPITMKPLVGPLDTRSVPADLLPGAFRYKLNMAVSTEGQMYRRPGWSKAFPSLLVDNAYVNADHHRRGNKREPITMLYEHTKDDGSRMLFDASASYVSVLDETAGTWSDIISFPASGSVWRAASLKSYILFADGEHNVYAYPDAGPAANTIPELLALQIAGPRVIVEFNGCILLMNVTEGGLRKPTKIVWCDLDSPLSWSPAVLDSVASYQDLPFGDEILAAAPLMNALYIYTRRSIWRCTVSGDPDKVFDFFRVYTEPKNQKGCLVYPYTLISTGSDHYYMSRESIYRFNPYMPAPENQGDSGEVEWLHRASGVIFTDDDTKMEGTQCLLPCGEYHPTTKELWFSWPSIESGVNNWTLVAQTQFKTADLVDAGFTAFANYRSKTASRQQCNELQAFLGASGYDYAIKEIGSVYYREYYNLLDAADDLELAAETVFAGYYSELRGLVPTGLDDKPKEIRHVLLDSEDVPSNIDCYVRCWVGNSQTLTDPKNVPDADNVFPAGVSCMPLWHQHKQVLLACQNEHTPTQMLQQNLRSSNDKQWFFQWEGNFLYFRLRIEGADGSPPIGGASHWNRLSFHVRAKS